MPSLATVKESKVQLVFGVDVVAQSLTVDATKIAGAVTASFVKTEIVWLTSYAPVDVSFTATGATGTTGVKVDVAF